MVQSIPSALIHSPGICCALVILPFPWLAFVRKPLTGGGAFVNSSRSGERRSFFNISLKNMNI